MRELTELLNEVRTSFPELNDLSITIDYKKFKNLLDLFEYDDGCGFFEYSNKRNYQLNVSTALKEAPEMAIQGGIAHELVHIFDDRCMDMFTFKLDELSRKLFEHYSEIDERNTDLGAILKGYGPHLLALAEFADKLAPGRADCGLSAEELRKILRN